MAGSNEAGNDLEEAVISFGCLRSSVAPYIQMSIEECAARSHTCNVAFLTWSLNHLKVPQKQCYYLETMRK